MSLEHEDILQLMVNILGGDIYDDDIPWRTSPPARRNAPPLDDDGEPALPSGFVTRILEEFLTLIDGIEVTTNAVNANLTTTVGRHNTTDRDDWLSIREISGNLIQAVARLNRISDDFVSNPEWNASTQTLSFAKGNTSINLPLKGLVTDVNIDVENQKLVVSKFGEEDRIDISYLFNMIIQRSNLAQDVQDSLSRADIIQTNGVGDEFLANDGMYKGVALSVVTI
jgi:hypothetical protein